MPCSNNYFSYISFHEGFVYFLLAILFDVRALLFHVNFKIFKAVRDTKSASIATHECNCIKTEILHQGIERIV